MNGSAIFLDNNRENEKNHKIVDLKLSLQVGGYKFSPIIGEIGNNAYVATPREVSFCQPSLNKC